MLLLLLAATDPLGLMAIGYGPNIYALTARQAASRLRSGAGAAALHTLFPPARRGDDAVHAFVRTALDWWTVSRPRRAADDMAVA